LGILPIGIDSVSELFYNALSNSVFSFYMSVRRGLFSRFFVEMSLDDARYYGAMGIRFFTIICL